MLLRRQNLSIQVAAAQTLAAASRTARGAPASNPSSGTSGRSNFSAGSLRILNARLVVCSRRRPCCGGCTGSTSRAREKRAAVDPVPAGVTLAQVALVQWKHNQLCAQTNIRIFKELHLFFPPPFQPPHPPPAILSLVKVDRAKGNESFTCMILFCLQLGQLYFINLNKINGL